jgi:long-subunit fatty acid transport protein
MPFPEQDGDHVYMLNTLEFESGYAFGVAGRFGVQTHFFNDRLRFGISYMMEAKPRFEGDLTISNPAGAMEYDAGTSDFGWARELALGVAGQLFNRRLTLAADFRWVDWSSAVDVIDFAPTAKDATRVPAGYAQIPLAFNMKWQDTYVFGAGAEYAVIPEFFMVRAGYNYGRAPATPTGINALFPPVNAHHVTGGIGLLNIYRNLSLNAAFEWALPGEVESDATNSMGYEPSFDPTNMQATGYRAAVKMQQFSAYLSASYQFD